MADTGTTLAENRLHSEPVQITGVTNEQLTVRLAADYYKWDSWIDGECCVSPTPFILTSAEWADVCRLALDFNQLLEKTISLVAANNQRLDYFKPGKMIRRMIAADRPKNGKSGAWTGISRFDFLPTTDGWKIAEFNTDVPGGQPEAIGLNAILAEHYPNLHNPNSKFVDQLIEHIRSITGIDYPVIGFVFASGYGEDLQVASLVRSVLMKRGLKVILGSPLNLCFDQDSVRMFQQKIDVVYRYFPAEWYRELPSECVSHYLSAYQRGVLKSLTPFAQLIAQNKKISAFWWRYSNLFSPAEKDLIHEHIPRTSLFQASRIDEYIGQRQSIVLKRMSGRMGEQVLMGKLNNREDWEEVITEIAMSDSDSWTVQERVETRPAEFSGKQMYPCVGVYLIGGKIAGAYTRLSVSPVTEYNAVSVATFID